MLEPTRINKYLSAHGYCSRREADRLITLGKVFVNGVAATLGTKIIQGDDVRVEGRDRKKPPKKIYILLNKPSGIITTSDRTKKDNIMDLIDIEDRVYPVGRLDVKSEGLIILTNDGILANRLMHPRYEHEKEYVVRVDRPLEKIDIGRMQSGVELDDGRTLPAKVRQLETHKFAIILREGRNRQIRRMCEALGYEIFTLQRTRVGSLKIPMSYPVGNWRYLVTSEVRQLKKLVGLKPGPPAKQKRKKRPKPTS